MARVETALGVATLSLIRFSRVVISVMGICPSMTATSRRAAATSDIGSTPVATITAPNLLGSWS